MPSMRMGEALLANFYAHSAEVDDLIKARLKDWTLAVCRA